MMRTTLLPLLVAGLLPAPLASAGDSDDDLRWPAAPDVHIDVEFVSGSIEFEGWDRDEVRVRARKRTRETLSVEASHDWISIGIPAAGLGWLAFGGGAEAQLRIDVPRGCEIRAKLINGPIRVNDFDGSLRLHTANGKIDVSGAAREARLESISSDIRFEGKASRVDARTISGAIDLKGVAEEVNASTTSGSIRVEGGTLERIDLRSLSGSIDLEVRLARNARVALKSYSGSIEVSLPRDTSARFELQSFSGELRSELGNGHSRSLRRGPGRHLDFDAGDATGRVSIETFSGSVRIEASD